MGLHRDGAQWNLPADVVDDRRLVNWTSSSMGLLADPLPQAAVLGNLYCRCLSGEVIPTYFIQLGIAHQQAWVNIRPTAFRDRQSLHGSCSRHKRNRC
jgi:hypothetical protein